MPTQAVVRWPNHWYCDQDHIRCIVPHCEFVTPSLGTMPQWDQLDEHCEATPGAEHKILKKMMLQSFCAINDCDYNVSYHANNKCERIRVLFAHEIAVHNSEDMSNLCSFVRLAREGRIRKYKGGSPERDCEKLAFDRMMEKVTAYPNEVIVSIFERSGYHNPEQQTLANMGKILTADPLAQPNEEPPYWWPIRAEEFLYLCRPRPDEPVDHPWRKIWTRLREWYADGRI